MAKLQRYKEALKSYDRALSLKQSDPLIWLNLGNVLGKLQQYVHAIGAYDKTIALGANEPLIWYNRGNALTKLGRYEEAVQSYDRLLIAQRGASHKLSRMTRKVGMGGAMLYTSWNAIKMLWLPTIGPKNCTAGKTRYLE